MSTRRVFLYCATLCSILLLLSGQACPPNAGNMLPEPDPVPGPPGEQGPPGTNATVTAGDGVIVVDGVVSLDSAFADGLYWRRGGNAGTTVGTDILGTTDDQPLELYVNGNCALRLEPTDHCPNLIGGFSGNVAMANVRAATIAGGGPADPADVSTSNRVTDDYGTIGGGGNNQAGDGDIISTDAPFATVAGGQDNLARRTSSTVGGGTGNTADSIDSTVGGGSNNFAQGFASTIGGGQHNNTTRNYSFIGGGFLNTASGLRSTISGGDSNTASGDNATIGGGLNNQANGTRSTIGGGEANVTSGVDSAIVGGIFNTASGTESFIGGGDDNEANTEGSAIAGGEGNRVTDGHGFIGGGFNNVVGDDNGDANNARFATVGGGSGNSAGGLASTIGGGEGNTASGLQSTVGGGEGNTAGNTTSTVAGGLSNTAGGLRSTIGGGDQNSAGGTLSTISGGTINSAGGNFSTVPGGRNNDANNADSFAAGRRAKANHDGAFVWGDSTNADVKSFGDDTFSVRASGGARFYSSDDLSTGVELIAGSGAWAAVSDRNAKENFERVDGRAVLQRVAEMPIETWNYKTQDDSVRHIGPMAQDFKAAFGVGHDERRISTIDADGVALAAIQGLHELLQSKAEELAEQRCATAEMRNRIDVLEARLAALESRPVSNTGTVPSSMSIGVVKSLDK